MLTWPVPIRYQFRQAAILKHHPFKNRSGKPSNLLWQNRDNRPGPKSYLIPSRQKNPGLRSRP
jgi:hypothetical protein